MKINELHNQPVEADTYEASMALNQLLKIGKHAIKIHNMIDDSAEMEAWVAKKIDLAGDYVKKVHGYMQGEKAGLYDDGGLTENVRYPNPSGKVVKKFATDNPDTKFVLSQNPNGKFRVTYNMDVNIGGVAKTGAQTMTVNGATGEFDNANDAIAAGKKDAADYYKDELAKSKQPRQPDPPFNLEDWSTDKVQEFGGDLIRLAKGQSIEMGGYDSYGYELDDGRPDDDDDEGNEAATDSIGGEVTSAIKMHRDYIDNMYYDKQVDPDKVKPNKETIEYAQAIIRKPEFKKAYQSTESVSEDAGEGHMSKSTLYHTAKYAIELMDMINKGDDLEGWVQSKLNKAADYLQGVHNYEEYQKLNPYREQLDSDLLQKHAGIIQKNIDEILARETSLDDVDTKPGMMRILAKRVNEVEKEIAKETRKNTDEAHGGQHSTSGRSMTKGEMNKREKIVKGMKKNKAGFKKRYGKDAEAVMYATATKNAMKDDETNESGILYRAGVKKYGKAGMKAIQSAAAKGANHQEIGKIKDKHLKDDEQMQEGIKDWAKNLAMAGVIVAGLAGVGSIQDAIDRSIPAVQAMETALEMAQDQGNDELADMIKKDLSAVKVRLESGKDLNFVKDMQSKYSKFIQTEGLAYESKLAIMLNQQLK